MITEIEKFLAAHVNGGAQSDVPEDVGARLKEITVDPYTVALAATGESSNTLH
jgi:hypothetical protein